MGLLVVGAMLSYGNPLTTPIWVLVVPMALLAINLIAAIITNARINQQPGLLVFHVSLLLILLLATVGRLTHMDAHLELVVGTEFEPGKLLETNAGPLHAGDLDKVHFAQGPFSVEYAPGMQRGLTHSHVKVKTTSGEWEERVVGDDRPLIIEGYRFYTTFNKGFTPVLTWMPAKGGPITGTVNMPSYPLFEYKQDNRWHPPGSDMEIKFWLQLNTGMKEDDHWVLDGRTSTGVLIVTADDARHEVQLGKSVDLQNGRLRFDALTTWMGYRLFYDPTIQWMFFVAIMGVLGLTQYFWKKINLQPWMDEKPDTIVEDDGKPSGGVDSQTDRKPLITNDPASAAYLTGDRQ
jgi:cytochrome c biogenesis protein